MPKILFFILIGLIVSFGFMDAQAAVSLSVTPVSGGSSLRFGRVSSGEETSQEVRIRVVSNDGQQYQVFHRLADSFLNEKNVPLGSGAVSTYTLIGSNGSGTLYAQNPETLGYTDQLLYSSASSGEGDNFTAVYVVNGDRAGATGNFFGRVQYAVRPIGGSGQDTVILNVTVDVSGDLSIEVNGAFSADIVRLASKEDQARDAFVRLSFRDHLGGEIKFYQEVGPFPQDEVFTEMDAGGILYTTSGSDKGELFPAAPSVLERRRTLIYSSQAKEDTFYVHFALNPEVVGRQRAGIFKGQLHYTAETQEGQSQYAIDLEAQIDPVFAIEIDLPPEGLSFDDLLPDGQPVLREIGVEVKSNLGKPYMVLQNVTTALTNEKGEVVPGEYFTVQGKMGNEGRGKMVYSDFRPVPVGEDTVFFSDNKGSSSRFKMIYRLRPFSGMAPGSYNTSVRFSLGEL
jgi:hypothetical protein